MPDEGGFFFFEQVGAVDGLDGQRAGELHMRAGAVAFVQAHDPIGRIFCLLDGVDDHVGAVDLEERLRGGLTGAAVGRLNEQRHIEALTFVNHTGGAEVGGMGHEGVAEVVAA